MIEGLKFSATGVGSLPHKDEKEALKLITKYPNCILYWPQLPQRSKFESMTVQYSEGLDFLEVDNNANVKVAGNIDKALERFYEKVLSADLDNFSISKKYAAGLVEFLDLLEKGKIARQQFIKGQVTGPWTLAGSIVDKDNRPIMHNPLLMDAVVNGLGLKAAWQKEQFKEFAKAVLICFDEPYLGCFGSAFTAINQNEVVKRFSDLINPLKDENTLIGIHCCGNTDWQMLLDIGFDIINFDAYDFLERFLLYPAQIKSFLEKGGIISWGLVPTGSISKDLNVENLIEKFKSALDILEKKGVDKKLVLNQSMFTPSCGMGAMSVENSVKASKLLAELSADILSKFSTAVKNYHN